MSNPTHIPCTFDGRDSLFPLYSTHAHTGEPISLDCLCNNMSVLVYLLQHNQIDQKLIPYDVLMQAYDWYKLTQKTITCAPFNYGGYCGNLTLEDREHAANILSRYKDVYESTSKAFHVTRSSLPQVLTSDDSLQEFEKWYRVISMNYALYEMPFMSVPHWCEGGVEGAVAMYLKRKQELGASLRSRMPTFGEMFEAGFARWTFEEVLNKMTPVRAKPGRPPKEKPELDPAVTEARDRMLALRNQLSELNAKRAEVAEEYKLAMEEYRLIK